MSDIVPEATSAGTRSGGHDLVSTDYRVRDTISASGWFRSDINGLRALAVLPVVAFHAGVPGFTGGFIGVDVFFVISGFLITTILLREVELTGRLNLGKFWLKRIRRLVPVSIVVTATTLAVALWALSPLQWADLAKQSAAAAFYVSNLLFSQQSLDYFAADLSTPSPFLHTWSLGVEEQFYLLWPLGLILAAVVGRRMGLSVRRVLHFGFAATALVSLSVSLAWTLAEPPSAFYLLPARAWEFAAGGLLALLPAAFRVPPVVRSTMVIVGVVALSAATLVFSPVTPFPGLAALVPVLATALIIVGGRGESAVWPSRLLSVRAMQWTGSLSYSWYLWHWPFIVLAAALFRSESVVLKVIAALLALLAATVTYHLVEKPVRFSTRFAWPARRTFLAAGAATVAVALVSGAVFIQGNRVLDQNLAFEKAITQVPDQKCDRWGEAPSGSPLCEMGDLESDTTVVLVGDSHAGQWKNALGAAARNEGIRLVVRWKSSCPAIALDTVNSRGEWDASCRPFQRKTMEIVDQLEPDAVLLAQAEAYEGRIADHAGNVLPRETGVALWRKAYARTVTSFQESTPRVGVILDNPRMGYDPNTCLIEAEDRQTDCRPTRAAALSAISALQEKSLEVISKFDVHPILAPVELLCGTEMCEVMDGKVPVYRDYNHLSESWTMTQLDALTLLLGELRDV